MSQNLKENTCDEHVFDELFRAHSKDLHNFLYYKFGAEYNPGDVVQDAFVKLWNNCQKVIPAKARSFLFTVANNQMLNEIARHKTVLNYRNEKPSVQTSESPQYIMEGNEYMDRLQKAIESLTEEQRVTLLMNRIEGKKHQEIADMLGVSRKAVEKRIYTALNILKEKVGKI